MNLISRNRKFIAAMVIAVVSGVSAASAFGQESRIDKQSLAGLKDQPRAFCSNNNWSSRDRVSFSELREMTIPAGGTVTVDAGRNGGISIKGENRSDVFVRACIQAWDTTEDSARNLAAQVRVNTMGTIKADGNETDKNWSVSYQILVPRSSDLNLKAHNGGISITGTTGRAQFETSNGGVSLKDLAGDVKGRTTNGGVNVMLSGTSWQGTGLDVTTTNGGVKLTLPSGYAARIETGTVNGGFKSDFPALDVPKSDEWGRRNTKQISADLNGGGPTIKVSTKNGGIKIGKSDGAM